MCGFYCIAFIGHILPRKIFLDCTNLLSPNGYKKNEEIINFKRKYGRRKKSRV